MENAPNVALAELLREAGPDWSAAEKKASDALGVFAKAWAAQSPLAVGPRQVLLAPLTQVVALRDLAAARRQGEVGVGRPRGEAPVLTQLQAAVQALVRRWKWGLPDATLDGVETWDACCQVRQTSLRAWARGAALSPVKLALVSALDRELLLQAARAAHVQGAFEVSRAFLRRAKALAEPQDAPAQTELRRCMLDVLQVRWRGCVGSST
jgi:hypothetical protein